MVEADGPAAQVLDPQLVEPFHHGRAHVAGGKGDRVISGRQSGIFQGGVLLTAPELDLELLARFLGEAQLVVGAQGIKENLHF